MTARDTEVRSDGLCAHCLGERHPEQSRAYAGTTAETDPYCSSTCCRAAHGVKRADLPALSTTPRHGPTTIPTRLQAARLELSKHRLALAVAHRERQELARQDAA